MIWILICIYIVYFYQDYDELFVLPFVCLLAAAGGVVSILSRESRDSRGVAVGTLYCCYAAAGHQFFFFFAANSQQLADIQSSIIFYHFSPGAVFCAYVVLPVHTVNCENWPAAGCRLCKDRQAARRADVYYVHIRGTTRVRPTGPVGVSCLKCEQNK